MALTIVQTIATRTRGLNETIRVRLARTTPRERILLGALVAGAVLYTPIAAMDARAQAETAYADALAARDTARRAHSQAVAANNRAARELAIRDMEDWGFSGANIDIVRVRIEQALTEAIAGVAMTGSAVETSDAVVTTGPVVWVPAQVQGDLTWTPTFGLLDEVAAWPEGFRVTRFAFERAPPPAFEGVIVTTPGRVTIGLEFPTRTAVAGGAGE